MKKFYIVISICFLAACNQDDSKSKTADADSVKFVPPVIIKQDTLAADSVRAGSDTSLLQLSQRILLALKQKDFTMLATYIHPFWQLRFSPYGFIDTIESQALSPYELKAAVKKSSILKWGSYDGSGDPIKMNIHQYFDKFVYNKDYLNAPEKAVNKFLGSGNSLNNLNEIYHGASFTEFYFPGIDPQYGGMDWQTLRLVFRKEKERMYLVAIIHDQWTS